MKFRKTPFIAVFACFFSVYLCAQTDFDTKFKLKWKTKIGVTTYRTNIIENNGYIFIGSNGIDRKLDNDSLDGVLKINAINGAIENKYQSQLLGDNDVTAIALKDGKLYFGTDNYYFYCFDAETGEELWKFQTPYDVESAPSVADLDNDGNDEVIFCVQNYGMYCLSATDGSVKWNLDSISSHHGNVAPLVVDCNNDGVLDVVGGFRGKPENSKMKTFKMSHYGDYLLALDGNNGLPIWSKSTGAGIHASPFLYKEKGELRIVSLDAYGELQFLNLNGKLVKDMGYGYNKYMSPVVHKKMVCVSGSISDLGDNQYRINEEGYNQYIGTDSNDIYLRFRGKTSATTVVADIKGNGQQQYIAVSEKGEIVIVNEDGTGTERYNLPAGAEATPLIKDVDGDGKLEILFAALDGNLYCFDTNSRGKVYYGQFRWTNSNVPVIK